MHYIMDFYSEIYIGRTQYCVNIIGKHIQKDAEGAT